MASVTERIREIHQPYGGYIKPSHFQKTVLNDNITLLPEENIHASLVGLAVDYLTRFMMGCSAEKTFEIALIGATRIGDTDNATKLLARVKGLDTDSISCACKLCGYDVCVRATPKAYKDVDGINPDENTIFNIKTMVERSISFFNQYGPIVRCGFTFEGGYTATVNTGDGDYLTEDTLWDFKVSKGGITSKHTLQLLMYYIMGYHSVYPEFQSIKKLGIYNPKLNIAYTYDISNLSQCVIDEVADVVIGYANESKASMASNTSSAPKEKSILDNKIWTLQNLAERYGVGKAKITKDFLDCGLPYFKDGRKYCFNPDEVIAWEIQQRSIPYGKNGRLELPGYTAYGIYLKTQLQNAKQSHDRQKIREIRKIMRENGFTFNWAMASTLLVVMGALFFYVWFYRG